MLTLEVRGNEEREYEEVLTRTRRPVTIVPEPGVGHKGVKFMKSSQSVDVRHTFYINVALQLNIKV